MLELIRNYSLCGSIVAHAADISDPEKYAAKQLHYYLNLITGHDLKAQLSSEKLDDAVIVFRSAFPLYGEPQEEYEADEVHWYTKDGRLYITGGCRGIIYAVYDFLESIGCRFFSEDCEKIPVYESLDIPDAERHTKPAFMCREFYYGGLKNHRFAAKRRVNHNLPANMGGHVVRSPWHSFTRLIPPAIYAKDHPEWYAMRTDGTRQTEHPLNFQLCLSNEELIEELIERTRQYLREHPDTQIFHLSQNDGGVHCHCPNCLAVDEEEGSPAALVVRTANRVAEAIEEEFPNVLIQTFAYDYSRKFPKYTRPRHNVSIQLCSIEACIAHAFSEGCGSNDHRKNADYVHDIKEWSSCCDKLFIWEYVTSFHHYLQPHPNWRVLQPNLQFYHQHNAIGVFSQGNINGPFGADLEELRCYLITSLLWDPYCDYNELLHEFTDHYYGPAAPFIREYIDAVCDACMECGDHPGCYQAPWSYYLAPKYMEIYDRIIKKAEDAVQGNVLLSRRVGKLRMSYRYTELYKEVFENHVHNPQKINEFFTDCLTYGITVFCENTDHTASIIALMAEDPRAKRRSGI